MQLIAASGLVIKYSIHWKMEGYNFLRCEKNIPCS